VRAAATTRSVEDGIPTQERGNEGNMYFNVLTQLDFVGSWLFAVVEDGQWRPGIGDPTVVGWVTVFAYLAAAFMCWRTGAAEKKLSARSPWFWRVFAVLLLLLGINKQLDLQSLITVVGRKMAAEQGWYEERKKYQAAFIACVAIVGLLSVIGLGWMVRKSLRRLGLALAGGVFLVAFVVIRASSFHKVDQLLKMNFAGLRGNWILELGGIACIGIAAVRNLNAARMMITPR
jgi:hypothetical protein